MPTRRSWGYILIAAYVTVILFFLPNNLQEDLDNALELKQYENHFTFLFPKKEYKGTVTFTDAMFDNKVGLCYQYQIPAIALKRKYWVGLDQYAKEMLFFHEMGHCLYMLDHNDNTVMLEVNGKREQCPASIMNSEVFGHTDCYKQNRQYYFNQLNYMIEQKEKL